MVGNGDDASSGRDDAGPRPALHQLGAGLPELDVLRVFGDFVARHGGTLGSQQSHGAFAESVARVLRAPRPTAVHGLRTEAMFAYVAAALGECTTIMGLDGGLFFADHPQLRRPDFFIATRQGERLLVEVKNHSPSDELAAIELRADYLGGLEECAARLGAPLKLAVYWRAAQLWTLVDVGRLERTAAGASLSLAVAMKRNEMALLGDCALTTAPPLSLRVYADPAAPSGFAADGVAELTIAHVAVCVNGQQVEDPVERRIASFLMMYGSWSRVVRSVEADAGEINWVEIAAYPDADLDLNDRFPPLLGWLSQMISREFGGLTVTEGEVSMLRPAAHPSSLGVVIPTGYQGKVLKLARFTQRPNFDDTESG